MLIERLREMCPNAPIAIDTITVDFLKTGEEENFINLNKDDEEWSNFYKPFLPKDVSSHEKRTKAAIKALKIADLVVVPSEDDKEKLKEAVGINFELQVIYTPYALEIAKVLDQPFESRSGILFFADIDGSDLDAMYFLAKEIAPKMKQAALDIGATNHVDDQVKINIMGISLDSLELYANHYKDNTDTAFKAWDTSRNSIEKYIDSSQFTNHGNHDFAGVKRWLGQIKVVVFPQRFGSFPRVAPILAMKMGVPIVCSSDIANYLDVKDQSSAIVVDNLEPENFARKLMNVYHDKILWDTVRAGAKATMRDRLSFNGSLAPVKKLVEQYKKRD